KSSIKDRLANFTNYGKIVKEAPLAIAVFLDKENSYHYEKDIMAIGACIQNMLLCAHSLGLGTCWLGQILNRKKEVEEFLGLEKRFEFMALISLGYPNKRVKRTSRKKLSELILKHDP
ncbi:MAG: nitroreductase family protein, partial [Candidatus Omnitrophica bacterium]|nr:nitroreductase family protein [Candidatus Omnitrophota bacterium]